VSGLVGLDTLRTMTAPVPSAEAEDGARQASASATGSIGDVAWSAAAAGVLRKARRLPADAPDALAWGRLARTTVEGLTIPPLGTAARAAGLAATGVPGFPPYTRGSRAADGTGWDVRTWVTEPDPSAASAVILGDLENGATSIWLTVGGSGTSLADLSMALAGVHLEMAPVVLEPAGQVADLAAATAFHALCVDPDVRPDPASSFGTDPVGRAIRGGPSTADVAELSEIASLAGDLGIRATVVDGTVAHEAGAGDTGEIGYALAVGAAYLRALTAGGVDVDTACGLLDFRFAVTSDQFPMIAKLRAARLTWNRLAELCGASPSARAQRQHAVTSRAMLTRHDPWVNLLRTTVSAFAAGVGGADVITVLPFDAALGAPDAFGRRLARNISTLLTEESHVAKSADPAGGAYAVEMLTADYADAAWSEFQRIEAGGGIIRAVADGSWRSRVETTAHERRRGIATRRQAITGVSEFPLAHETLLVRNVTPLTDGVERWASPFEELRDQPAGRPAILRVVGDPADAEPRARFVQNLLAAGGIGALPEPSHDPDHDLASLQDATVIMVGSDDAYAADGASAIARVRNDGAARVFLAGRPPAALSGLVDGFVTAGDDVLAFLHLLRGEAVGA
jgi:methylmalonyl-CoA mutase